MNYSHKEYSRQFLMHNLVHQGLLNLEYLKLVYYLGRIAFQYIEGDILDLIFRLNKNAQNLTKMSVFYQAFDLLV